MGDMDFPLQIIKPFRPFAQGMQDKNGLFSLQQFLGRHKGADAE